MLIKAACDNLLRDRTQWCLVQRRNNLLCLISCTMVIIMVVSLVHPFPPFCHNQCSKSIFKTSRVEFGGEVDAMNEIEFSASQTLC